MTRREEYSAALRATPPAELDAYLTAQSGLPGPRGNLELADAFTDSADEVTILRLVDADDEYLRFCGTQALGRLLVRRSEDAAVLTLLRERATDELWRVREAASRALQVVGDADSAQLRTIVADWATDPLPFVRRAALAAICEPRLLSDPASAALALRVCEDTTDWLAARPATARRAPDLRNLRQALGYCWSVAIAAEPVEGLRLFERLRSSTDPDIAWIVRTNLGKSRLRRLIS